jgi:hypothetical protein
VPANYGMKLPGRGRRFAPGPTHPDGARESLPSAPRPCSLCLSLDSVHPFLRPQVTDTPESDARKLFSAHGQAFQYAVLRYGEGLSNSGDSQWVFEAAEFPVAIGESVIHIDFILTAKHHNIYLVGECKRADPAKARWFFVKAPYTRRNPHDGELYFEQVFLKDGFPLAHVVEKSASMPATHLGIELKTDAKGDGISSRSGIGEATTQVLRGANGLAEFLFHIGPAKVDSALFVPAIFTTAELWVAEGDLALADPRTGALPPDWGPLKKADWLWYTYNQSPHLRHKIPTAASKLSPTISRALKAEYSRTIAVVGPDGLDRFLRSGLIDWL